MKKSYLLLGGLMLSGFSFAQVGVDTETPKTTMDVSAKRNTAGALLDNSKTFGLQAPRLTREELTNNTATYGTNQNGALVYITDVSAGTQLGQRIKIDAVGYYYFDGSASIWQKFNIGASGTATPDVITASNGLNRAVNAIKLGGTLSENTVINQGANTLTFNNTTAGGTKLISDGTSSTPKAALQIQDGGQGLDKVLTSDANGNALWKTPTAVPTEPWNIEKTTTPATSNDGNIYQNGYIGITSNVARTDTRGYFKTNTIPRALSIVGDGNGSDDILIQSYAGATGSAQVTQFKTRGTIGAVLPVQKDDNVGFLLFGANGTTGANPDFIQSASIAAVVGTGTVNASNVPIDLTFNTNTNGSTERLRITSAGNVGVGTISPDSKLHVAGSVKIVDGTQGVDKVFTSDANGLGSWKTPTAIPTEPWNVSTTATQATGNAQDIYQTGNVGIGTSTAPTAKLDVWGKMNLDAANGDKAVNNIFKINIGRDGYGYGNRTENNGILFETKSSIQGGNIARINFGDTNASTAEGTRYLSFSVGKTLNELLYITDKNSGAIGIGTASPGQKLDVSGIVKSTGFTDGNNTFANNDFGIFGTTNKWLRLATRGSDNGEGGTSKIAFFTNATDANPTGVGSVPVMAIDGGKVGIGTSTPTRSVEINALSGTASGTTSAPIKITNLEKINAPTDDEGLILTINNSGDIRKVPINNMLGGLTPMSYNGAVNGVFDASGNESVIWLSSSNQTVKLPVPSSDQLGKTLYIIASYGAVTLNGARVELSNAVQLNTVPSGKRVTLFAVKPNWATANQWIVIAKDF